MTKSIYDPLYPEHDTILKTAHDWQEYIKQYKVRNNCPHLPVAIAVPTQDFLDLVNNFKQVSKSNRSRRKHSHFLSWLIANRPDEYNRLLKEYNDFFKDNPEKTDTL